MLIKYIKNVLWRVAKCLSYIEEARCLKVKYIGDSPKCRIERLWLDGDFFCHFVEIFNSDFSIHTLVLVIFYVVTFVYDIYCGVAGIKNVKKRYFGGVGR